MPLVPVQGKVAPTDRQNLLNLVKLGRFGSESDAVREAVKLLLRNFENDLTQEMELTDDEEDMLLVAGQDYYDIYHNFEEKGIRKFLKARYSNDEWFKRKEDKAVAFVCDMKRLVRN